MSNKENLYEEQFFKYFDEIKLLFFPEKWNAGFLDYSKNELLAITYIHRYKKCNISEMAEFLMAPLNTVTGVVNRLEKKGIVERTRDNNDKRIDNIVLTEKGIEQYNECKSEIMYYIKEVYESLSLEERNLVYSIIIKIINVINEPKKSKNEDIKKEKKIRKINIE